MEHENHTNGTAAKGISFFMNTANWWKPLLFILVISVAGVGMIGYQTYFEAPPMSGFQSEDGQPVITRQDIIDGQQVFHKYALMEYGSFFGDGAQRGPDFTAEALHLMSDHMHHYYLRELARTAGREPSDMEAKITREDVMAELKVNRYDPDADIVTLSDAQVYAWESVRSYYQDRFLQRDDHEGFPYPGYITDEDELSDLSAFFYWGAWVCVAERPGETFSYTHNWPFDPDSGNTPTSPVVLWTVLGLLGFVLGCGIVLYFIGQYNQLPNKYFKPPSRDLLDEAKVAAFKPTPTQRASFKFFFVAVLLFAIQVMSGIVTINDFVNFLGYFGIHPSPAFPVTVARSWHLMLALYWITACWIASSIFILPILAKKEIKGQLRLINILFVLVFILVGGSLVGMVMGPKGLMGDWWHLLGHQGWEFVDFGKIYQGLLMVIFLLWGVIVYRGVRPAFIKGQPWNLPNWIIYSVVGIPLLFLSGFVATPETNFVIADFWRWMVIHMWVEAFFEVFITVIVSYLLVLMGLVSRQAAVRVIYIATLLFLGTGLLGISHNFYWNAKPVATMALGSVFSTLQFVPLILLTVEAWRFKNMPKIAINGVEKKDLGNFGFPEVFWFLVAVNFWNFFGAGVMGIIINLPLMNYYEHGTYLTINHAHAALMGVYGNISIAALLFASRLLFKPGAWSKRLVMTSFWAINIGLMLMVVLDLFPAGAIQFKVVVEKGLWYARSHAFIGSGIFEQLTWLRGVGASVFFFAGVLPLTWFIVTRARSLKKDAAEVVAFDDEDPRVTAQQAVEAGEELH